MGDAKRRKLSDPNYGTSLVNTWTEYKGTGSPSEKLPDFGQLVSSQIGDKPIKITLFDESSLYVGLGSRHQWFISFLTQMCAIEPAINLNEIHVGTIELKSVVENPEYASITAKQILETDKLIALNIAKTFREGFLIRARYDIRYWAEATKEWVVPFELV